MYLRAKNGNFLLKGTCSACLSVWSTEKCIEIIHSPVFSIYRSFHWFPSFIIIAILQVNNSWCLQGNLFNISFIPKSINEKITNSTFFGIFLSPIGQQFSFCSEIFILFGAKVWVPPFPCLQLPSGHSFGNLFHLTFSWPKLPPSLHPATGTSRHSQLSSGTFSWICKYPPSQLVSASQKHMFTSSPDGWGEKGANLYTKTWRPQTESDFSKELYRSRWEDRKKAEANGGQTRGGGGMYTAFILLICVNSATCTYVRIFIVVLF